MEKSKYFYDNQIRRYLLQIARIFSGYQVTDGFATVNNQRVQKYKQVPITYANLERLGASYFTENSENTITHAPAMAFYISDFQPSSEMRLYQHHTQSTNFTEKAKNPTTGEYVNVEGTKYTIQQAMPSAFEMKITLDIWTSSSDQKLELLEQILVYFNIGFAFRVSSSRFDMGQLSNIELESINWTSRSVPVGTSTELEVTSLTFKISPVYISAPAKITRQNAIKNISIGLDVEGQLTTIDELFGSTPIHHLYVSPSGYDLNVSKELVNGVRRHVARLVTGDSEASHSWLDIFRAYGVSETDSPLVRIRHNDDLENEEYDVYAELTVTDDPLIAVIDYDTDTFRVNTLRPISMIISGTNTNQVTFDQDVGTRILVASAMDQSNPVWGMDVRAESIIEKTENGWVVAFDPSNAPEDQFVLHSVSKEQYRFIKDQSKWTPVSIGTYSEGYWAFDIQKVSEK